MLDEEADQLAGAVGDGAADQQREHEADRARAMPSLPSSFIAPPVPATKAAMTSSSSSAADARNSRTCARAWAACASSACGLGRVEAPVEDLQIDVHPLPRGVRLDAVRAQEIGGDQRRDHARDEQAHQHRQDDGEAERLEILAGDAGHQRDREEHGDDRHGRRQHGEADLVGRVERGLIGRFAHAHVPDDVLDLDDRVVDQHAGDQAHRHRRHEVQRDPHHAHERRRRGSPTAGWRARRSAVARMSRRKSRTTRTARIAPSIRPSIAERYCALV